MTRTFAVVTTFPNKSWDEYAAVCLQSFAQKWPITVPHLVQVDNAELQAKIDPLMRVVNNSRIDGWCIADEAQLAWVEENKKHDHPTNYRYQYSKFANKIFAIHKGVQWAKENNTDWLIWLDADVMTTGYVTMEDLEEWCPDGVVASYLGRKDWNHSECGWVAYNLRDGGAEFIEAFMQMYLTGDALKEQETHDSYLFDRLREKFEADGKTFLNLTQDQPGVNIWLNSPLATKMEHWKGQRAKKLNRTTDDIKPQEKALPVQPQGGINIDNLKVGTKNCIDNGFIVDNVRVNLQQIDKWVKACDPNDETVIICSAGPSLDPEQVRPYYDAGYKIVAVKHAINKLLAAGITPWACVLLDPREHVKDFVTKPSKDTIYFVASMCQPSVVQELQRHGATIYGYHAGVGAGEDGFLPKWSQIVNGGSAAATRGMFLMDNLGFRKFILFGYDLCEYTKPNLSELDTNGNNKYYEIPLEVEGAYGVKHVRTFWTKGEFLAQIQELRDIIRNGMFNILDVKGEGVFPWMFKHMSENRQWQAERRKSQEAYMRKLKHYSDLLGGNKWTKPCKTLKVWLLSLMKVAKRLILSLLGKKPKR